MKILEKAYLAGLNGKKCPAYLSKKSLGYKYYIKGKRQGLKTKGGISSDGKSTCFASRDAGSR